MVPPLPRYRFLNKRQDASLNIPSTGSGINPSSALVVDPTGSSASSLAYDTGSLTGATPSSVPFATVTPSMTQTDFSSPTSVSSSSAANTGNNNGLSTGAVVAGCIATLIGVIILILIGVWLYKRYVKSLKRTYRTAAAAAQHRRSRQGSWAKLGDEKHGGIPMKEAEFDSPMGKMFKKAPSVRTAYTHKSFEPMELGIPQSLAQYHPELAKHNASSEAVTVHRPFIGSAESGPTISWDADTLHDDAVTSEHLSSSSPGSIAIPTPAATRTLHRWQSAEVIIPDAETATTDSNPFEAESERRKGSSNKNPFFKGSDINLRRRSNSVTSTSNQTNKGKERAAKTESFASQTSDMTILPKPPLLRHMPSGSSSSAMQNPHAVQALVAALDVSEQEIQDRLRIVSMQPSVLTTTSTASTDGGNLALSTSFPLPPSSNNPPEHHQ
ncbi:hypothetical protein JOM56_001159 [Amanita muscaria]